MSTDSITIKDFKEAKKYFSELNEGILVISVTIEPSPFFPVSPKYWNVTVFANI